MNIAEHFPDRNAKKCSLGAPCGNGVRLGYQGWGQYDLEFSPVLPIDMQVFNHGLEGQFDEVESKDLLHRLHGDCTLTHGIKGIVALLAPKGTLSIEFLSLNNILAVANKMLEQKDWVGAQIAEKVAFGQPVDTLGVLYPQTMIHTDKIKQLLCEAGCGEIQIVKEPVEDWIPIMPDSMRMGEVNNHIWEASAKNFETMESLHWDRPSCLICDKVATKRDHDRRFFARYCKDHYEIARNQCDQQTRRAFSVIIRARRFN